MLVDRVDPGAGVNDENNGISGVHRDTSLDGDLIGKSVVIESPDATGVDEFTGRLGARASRGNTIPRDSGHVVHDGDTTSHKAVEKRGFPDVGTSDDGDLEWADRHCLRVLGASTLALNIGAELKKFFVDHLVAAIDMVEAIDFGHTVCSQGCENKRG